MASYSNPDMRDSGAAAAERMKEKVARTTETVRESVRDGAHRAQEEAEHAVGAFRDRVSERPLTSLAIGVCLGLLAGLLLHRR
jgi:ElaB/YqjD/DUF883 family membrane-anchored ribosome-binding protein